MHRRSPGCGRPGRGTRPAGPRPRAWAPRSRRRACARVSPSPSARARSRSRATRDASTAIASWMVTASWSPPFSRSCLRSGASRVGACTIPWMPPIASPDCHATVSSRRGSGRRTISAMPGSRSPCGRQHVVRDAGDVADDIAAGGSGGDQLARQLLGVAAGAAGGVADEFVNDHSQGCHAAPELRDRPRRPALPPTPAWARGPQRATPRDRGPRTTAGVPAGRTRSCRSV